MGDSSGAFHDITSGRRAIEHGQRKARSRGRRRKQPFRLRISSGARRGPRGGASPRRPEQITLQDGRAEISIVVYLDTEDDRVISGVLSRVDILRSLAGCGGPERDISVQRGSIFRRSWAAVRRGLSSRDARDRLAKVERAIELRVLDQHQAQVDQMEAAAVNALIVALHNVPRACIRIGSILLVKYGNEAGEPIILVRNLSQAEIRALERYPEIQSKPENVLIALATVLDDLGRPTAVVDEHSPPARS